eukprot:TRINITY_DN41695_c0_g1_i1.p1 TRINITY_DN41695_c0_g1~~TRINITY_DN41695_c0_g1_i1.p1  ORF type:complete len:519 (+),score=79.06 TRINITY_DN41695_c0_g1_i1:75-1631(+)
MLLLNLKVFLSFAVVCSATAGSTKPKHILAVIIDDLGFDDLGFRNENQIKTPNFNALANDGVILNNYYVQPSCSPTRATIMTGRKPVHTGINYWIPNEAYGLPLNETTLAQLFNARGFKSHAVGKWHLGFFKTAYTPTFRGFDSFYGYYEGSEDYFQHTTSGGLDFHDEQGQNCGPGCTKLVRDNAGQYSTNLYTKRAVDIIEAHDASTPFFMYLAYQGVHAPREAPDHYVKPYSQTIRDKGRRVFAGMVSALDEGMGNVTAALKAKGMFEDTLIFVTTDNGGPTTECSTTGQSNWPLRGSKCSLWEGGTRGTSFLYWSGLPETARGLSWAGLSHAADWMPTLTSAVGSSVKEGETLPLDGIDLWAAILSNATSPRAEVYYGISQGTTGPAVRDVTGNKLIIGGGWGKGAWSPQQLPNQSRSPQDFGKLDERAHESDHMLYFLPEDPGEHKGVSAESRADIHKSLLAIVDKYAATKVPQLTNDPSCPRFAPRKAKEGPWIGPWCDSSTEEELVAIVAV